MGYLKFVHSFYGSIDMNVKSSMATQPAPFIWLQLLTTGKGSKDDSGSQGRAVKKRSNQLT